tara:strand:- start:318 stop:692 length:375 start_codon:yes stop_codon:yes gene_type:complete
MAHFAELDKDNLVVRVVVVSDQHELDGENWCKNFFGGGVWKQTSYNTIHNKHSGGKSPLRKNYAGVGFRYYANLDAFIPPKPFASWVLDEEAGQWLAPVPIPTDGLSYEWDESSTSWVQHHFHG